MIPGLPTNFPTITGPDLLALVPLLVGGLVLVLGVVVWATLRRMSRPPRRTYAWAVSRSRAGDPGELDEPLAFASREETHAGRRVSLWEIEGRDADGPVVILTHGWGEGKVLGLDRVAQIAGVASRVIAWDMPGHGESAGSTTLGSAESRALASLAEGACKGTPIVLWGWSLGAEVSVRAAALLKQRGVVVDGLLLESGFRTGTTPARNVMRSAGYPSGWTLDVTLLAIGSLAGRPLDRFGDLVTTARAIAGVPALVLHGTRDRVCPPEDGEAIGAALGARYEPLEGAGHLDLWDPPHRDRTVPLVSAFLSEIRPSATRRA